MAIVRRLKNNVGPGRADRKKLRETTEDDIQRHIVEDGGHDFDFSNATWRLPDGYVRGLREHLGLTQTEFAERFALSERTVQEWEQGRSQPDAPARALLRVIAHAPSVAARALRRPSA
jgi:putative transcriptional regulator